MLAWIISSICPWHRQKQNILLMKSYLLCLDWKNKLAAHYKLKTVQNNSSQYVFIFFLIHKDLLFHLLTIIQRTGCCSDISIISFCHKENNYKSIANCQYIKEYHLSVVKSRNNSILSEDTLHACTWKCLSKCVYCCYTYLVENTLDMSWILLCFSSSCILLRQAKKQYSKL